jgi:hypothetical protein
MRVIKHGNRFEKGPVKCFNCFAEIMYCDFDVHNEYINRENELGTLESERVKGIKCPECNSVIEIKGE